MRAATQVAKTKPATNIANESAICQTGTPKGIRTNMAIGEVKGIKLNQVAIVPCGSLINTPNDRI